MTRRSYAGGAAPTTATGPVNAAAQVIPCVALVGWPTGATGYFAAVIDRDTAKEEKVLCERANGNDLVVAVRGYDGTTAQDHAPNAPVEHVYTAIDADEANAHVNDEAGVHGLGPGVKVVGTSGAQTLTDKTFDFSPTGGKNVATNIPPSAAPEITDLIAAEATARQTGDALNASAISDRYTKAEIDALLTSIRNESNRLVPIGAVEAFAGSVPPNGWLLCDGAAVSKDTYPSLFAAIGTSYGGNGTPFFNLPNLGNRKIVGAGGGVALAQTFGSDTHTITTQNMPSHDHSATHDHVNGDGSNPLSGGQNVSHNHGLNQYPINSFDSTGGGRIASGDGAAVPSAPVSNGATGVASSDHQHRVDIPAFTGRTSAEGGGQALDTRDPSLVLNYIIRVV